jgi:hypothetical protein
VFVRNAGSAIAHPYLDGGLLVESEDGAECLVDAPHFLWGYVPREVAESLRVNGANLLDEHPGAFAGNVDLGPERCGTSAERSGGDEDDRSREELVRLDDDAEPIAVLFVTDSFGEPEPVDVTPEHEALP